MSLHRHSSVYLRLCSVRSVSSLPESHSDPCGHSYCRYGHIHTAKESGRVTLCIFAYRLVSRSSSDHSEPLSASVVPHSGRHVPGPARGFPYAPVPSGRRLPPSTGERTVSVTGGKSPHDLLCCYSSSSNSSSNTLLHLLSQLVSSDSVDLHDCSVGYGVAFGLHALEMPFAKISYFTEIDSVSFCLPGSA